MEDNAWAAAATRCVIVTGLGWSVTCVQVDDYDDGPERKQIEPKQLKYPAIEKRLQLTGRRASLLQRPNGRKIR